MRNMRKRIERLEQAVLPARRRVAANEVIARALRGLSDEDLDLLGSITQERPGGPVKVLTERERLVQETYLNLVDRTCQSAGWRCLAEFEKSWQATHHRP